MSPSCRCVRLQAGVPPQGSVVARGPSPARARAKEAARRARTSRSPMARLQERASACGLSVYFIHTECTAKEGTNAHAHPETAGEKAHCKELYDHVSVRSESPAAKRSQSPTPNKSMVCRFWKQGDSSHGSSCRSAHTSSAAPAPQTSSDTEGKSAGQKRRERRKRSKSRVSSSSSASGDGKSS